MSAGFPAAPPGLFPTFSNSNNSANGSSIANSAQSPFTAGSYFYPPQQQTPQVNGDKPRIKLKRTRQRVDAGEPRNTYNNIAGYTPGRVAPSPFGGGGGSGGGAMPSTGGVYSPAFRRSPDTTAAPLHQPQNYFRAAYENVYGAVPGYWSMPYFHNLLRPPMQASAAAAGAASNPVECKKESESDEKIVVAENVNGPVNDRDDCDEEDSTIEDSEYEVRQKKARVENIVTAIQPGTACPPLVAVAYDENGCRPPGTASPDGGRVVGSEGTPKSKRKQYQPQQLDFVPEDRDVALERDSVDPEGDDNAPTMDDEFEADDSLGDDETDEKSADQPEGAGGDGNMKTEIKRMRSEIFVMQQRYMEMFSQQKRYAYGSSGLPPTTVASSIDDNPRCGGGGGGGVGGGGGGGGDDGKLDANDYKRDKDIKSLADGLKSELVSVVNGAVDKIMGAYSRAEAERAAARQNDQRQQQRITPVAPRPPFYFPPFYYNPSALPLTSNFAFGNNGSANVGNAAAAAAAAAAAHSIFPHYGNAAAANAPFVHNFGFGSTAAGGPKTVSEDGCLAFGLAAVASRKKRSKVTDTRVSKIPLRHEDSAGNDGSPAVFGYPSMVAQQTFQNRTASFNNSLEDSDLGAASPDNSDGTGSETAPYDPNTPQSTTLTPMHLRKAKLMFFYTRYPSSALLKAYFPDIRFNKNNTAQLVKWFSNFREFYYIQMEKYARQALAEGSVRSADEIQVCVDSELYKVLNLHYNRNNHIQVPPSFRRVIEATLREFFAAVQSGRDAEPSWKKAIYKIIARLDEQIPEYFKTPNFLEQLE